MRVGATSARGPACQQSEHSETPGARWWRACWCSTGCVGPGLPSPTAGLRQHLRADARDPDSHGEPTASAPASRGPGRTSGLSVPDYAGPRPMPASDSGPMLWPTSITMTVWADWSTEVTRYGFVDVTGKLVVPPRYEGYSYCHDAAGRVSFVIALAAGREAVVLDLTGKVIARAPARSAVCGPAGDIVYIRWFDAELGHHKDGLLDVGTGSDPAAAGLRPAHPGARRRCAGECLGAEGGVLLQSPERKAHATPGLGDRGQPGARCPRPAGVDGASPTELSGTGRLRGAERQVGREARVRRSVRLPRRPRCRSSLRRTGTPSSTHGCGGSAANGPALTPLTSDPAYSGKVGGYLVYRAGGPGVAGRRPANDHRARFGHDRMPVGGRRRVLAPRDGRPEIAGCPPGRSRHRDA